MRRNLKRHEAVKPNANTGVPDRFRASPAKNHLSAHLTGHPWEVVKTLVNGGGTDPSRLLELYYWTREPGIVELIRAYLDLPETAQRGLGDFLLNGRPQSVQSGFDPQGRLVLSRSAPPVQADKTGQTATR